MAELKDLKKLLYEIFSCFYTWSFILTWINQIWDQKSKKKTLEEKEKIIFTKVMFGKKCLEQSSLVPGKGVASGGGNKKIMS